MAIGYISADVAFLVDGAVGLISIHLAFYQMNPWPTALAAFSIFGTYMSSTPVGIFCTFCPTSMPSIHSSKT